MEPSAPCLVVRVVYTDDDLIEIEGRLSAGGWAARASAYDSAVSVQDAATDAESWTRSDFASPHLLQIGDNKLNGWISTRLRQMDKAGHIECHVQLATMSESRGEHSGENIWRVSLRFRSEVGLIERFARELKSIAAGSGGEATLLGVQS